ncbi:MAG: rod-binding protein [Sphingomonadales bacterium]
MSIVPTLAAPSSVQTATSMTAQPVKPDLKAAAQRFEAVFLREVISTMRKGKLADEMFGSSATDNFREMADAHTADAMAKMGAFGIANLVEKQLGAPK